MFITENLRKRRLEIHLCLIRKLSVTSLILVFVSEKWRKSKLEAIIVAQLVYRTACLGRPLEEEQVKSLQFFPFCVKSE